MDGGKTKITREEPKDFSRIIAANINAENDLLRTKIDNITRLVIYAIGLVIAFIYKYFVDNREAELIKKERIKKFKK